MKDEEIGAVTNRQLQKELSAKDTELANIKAELEKMNKVFDDVVDKSKHKVIIIPPYNPNLQYKSQCNWMSMAKFKVMELKERLRRKKEEADVLRKQNQALEQRVAELEAGRAGFSVRSSSPREDINEVKNPFRSC